MTLSLRDLPLLAAPWLRRYKLNRGFWLFFTAAFCYDAGFGLFFFLFNLYLLDYHFNERAIGLVNGALSLGLVVGTLPVGILTRRIGARRLLIMCFIAGPAIGVLRAFFVWEQAAIALAFLTGIVLCVWIVCFLPVTASLTSDANRAAATGLIFSVGVGSTALGSAVSGYLSQWVGMFGSGMGPADVKRIVLLASCGIVACGVVPLLRLPEARAGSQQPFALRQNLALLRDPFLRRFVPWMALWTSLLAAITTFAPVYFTRQRHVALAHVGLIFSASQLAQLLGGLLVPFAECALGIRKAIFVSQLATGILLALTVLSPGTAGCVIFFCAYSGVQWICSPAMYTLLMNNTAEADRAGASALVMFGNSLVTAAGTSSVGILLLHFGYSSVIPAIALLMAVLALAFQWSIAKRARLTRMPLQAESFTD